MPFNEEYYTEDQLLKAFIAVQNHSFDGSAVDAGCQCVPAKHMFEWELYAEEGESIVSDERKKEFYHNVGALARSLRKSMETDQFDMRRALHEAGLNPGAREYLPHGLTEQEHSHPAVTHKLSACIKEAELSCCGKHTTDYEQCSCNPIAVCRASVEHLGT